MAVVGGLSGTGFEWDTRDLEGSSIIKAEDLMTGIDSIESFVNTGIGTTPTLREPARSVDGWIKPKHIFKPEFFGSPSPRMTAVSSQVHWRQTADNWQNGVVFQSQTSGTDYAGIPGTCTRIKNKDKLECFFMASFYCFEMGGLANPAHDTTSFPERTDRGYESYDAGDIYLKVDGDVHGSTRRTVYTSLVKPEGSGGHLDAGGFALMSMIGRHQHSICKRVVLEPGIHDIGLVFKGRKTSRESVLKNDQGNNVYYRGESEREYSKWKHVFFLSRNMVVDCMYYAAGT